MRPDCSIAWDKTHDPNVTGYQLTIIDQSNQAKKAVHFPYIPERFLAKMQVSNMKHCGT